MVEVPEQAVRQLVADYNRKLIVVGHGRQSGIHENEPVRHDERVDHWVVHHHHTPLALADLVYLDVGVQHPRRHAGHALVCGMFYFQEAAFAHHGQNVSHLFVSTYLERPVAENE